jgi:hypothetical protein
MRFPSSLWTLLIDDIDFYFLPSAGLCEFLRIARPTSLSGRFHWLPQCESKGFSSDITPFFDEIRNGYDVRNLIISRNLVVVLQLGINDPC